MDDPNRLTDRENKNVFRWAFLICCIFTSINAEFNPIFSGAGAVGNGGVWPHYACSPAGCWAALFPQDFNWRIRWLLMLPAIMGIAVFEILRDKK